MNTSRAFILLCACGLIFGCEDKQPSGAKPPIPAPGHAGTPAPKPVVPQPASGSMPATGSPAASGASGQAAGNVVTVLNLTFPVPEGWQPAPPGNVMRLAEMHVPGPGGDASKECLVVFTPAGGDLQTNISRWAGQVRGSDGQPAKPEVKDRTVAGMPAKVVELHGAYTNMGETTAHENWTMRAAIIDTPQGSLFVKMTGPAEQMAAQAEAFNKMLDNAKVP